MPSISYSLGIPTFLPFMLFSRDLTKSGISFWRVIKRKMITMYDNRLDDYLEYSSGKEIHSITFPSQVTYKFSKGNSMAVYLEYQKEDYLHTPLIETHRYLYFSPSYNHFGKWIVTLFGDFESKANSPVDFDNLKEKYFGFDITYYMSDNNIVSLFFGSQKGGLVCANGTCIVQPDFKEGFKITSRMIF